MGSWDATNNNPSLSSGGGEATSGTTTSTTANKLVDSSASFLTTVTIGDQVINQVDGQNALVSNVDSDTTLSLDNDIMVSGEAYTIDNSPFITQGHYYVVNVGGTTTLNGISNWSVGDWVIAGANNEWTKLDHTQIDGTGTGDANDGNIPRFTASNIIGDSIIRETGGNLITVSGTLSTTGNLNAQGDFAINTDKFTTQASTGNTAFTGDLAINTNKFTVNATSGNTVVAGTLDVTSTASIGSHLTINGVSAGTSTYQQWKNDGTLFAYNGSAAAIISGGSATDYVAGNTTGSTSVILSTNNTARLTINGSGYTKFTKSTGAVVASFYDGTYGVDLAATATGGSIQTFNTNQTLNLNTYGTGDITFTTSGTSERMRIDSSGNVGIGTDSPDNILHIRKGDTTYASQVGADTMLFLETTNVSNALQFTSANTGQQYIMFGDDDPNAGWISYSHSDNNLNFRVNGLERMRIDSSGQVLIDVAGTNGSDLSTGGLAYRNNSGSYLQLSSGVHTDAAVAYFYRKDVGGTSVESFGNISNSGLGLVLNGGANSNQLVLSQGENVGIGTDDPNQEDFGTSNRVLSVKAPTSGGVGSIELIGLGNTDGDEVGYVNFMSQSATNSLASIVGLRRSDDETGKLAFRTAGTTKFTIEDDNQIRYVGDFYFSTNTSNGSDDGSLNFSGGGGGFGSTRGASIGLAGNEDGNGGLMQLIAGNGVSSNIRFHTSTQIERMRLQANGRLTLGDNLTISAANNLTLTNASSAEIDINCTGGHNYRIASDTSDDFIITDKTVALERMRITSGGGF